MNNLFLLLSLQKTKAPRRRFELLLPRWRTGSQGERKIAKLEVEKYLKIREISGISHNWLGDIKRILIKYLEHINWTINEDTSLDYIKKIKSKYSITSYRKQTYQIRKFLTYLNLEWAKNIKPPSEPQNIPKRFTKEDIRATLSYFKGHELYLKIKSLILLGSTSGMRAHELYQLTLEDIDIENRVIHVYHDPSNGYTTKTKKSRITMFNDEAKQILKEYLSTYMDKNDCNRLFPKRQCQHVFKFAPLHVKDLRKFFSQEWDRRGGPTSIKKILMGHRLDADLKHYNAQNEEDLRDIYNSVDLAI